MRKKTIRHKLYRYMEKPDYSPQSRNQLYKSLGLKTKRDRRALKDILFHEKIRDRIIKNEDGTYCLPQKLTGQLLAHARGFGFVKPDDDIFDQDIFIASTNLGGALDQDKVLVEVFKNEEEGRRPEGRVTEVIERGNTRIVGTFEQYKNNGFVIADNERLNKDVYISNKNYNNAKNGDKVVVDITKWPEHHKNPEGEVIEVLGKPDEAGVDIMSIIKSYDVPVEFSDQVLEEAESVSTPITKEELENRLDLRNETIFTIDGDTAKDFDDAVSIEKLPNGNYKLGVHIADVSHYVKEESSIDLSAEERGTSIYALNKVVPMLPEVLSNNMCSLVPDQDRLTYSCIMEVTPKGEVVDYNIQKSVIHSDARMTYDTVNRFLGGEKSEETNYLEPFKYELETMEELAKILREERRGKRGSIDFDFEEAEITVDDDGKPTDIQLRERGVSERLIEEFMLLANETVAAYTAKTPLTFMYRNHPQPDSEKLKEFRNFLSKLGLKFGKRDEIPTNQDYKKLLEDVKGKPYENAITLLALRTMQQALYEAENNGHYALGAENYTHFTSPIRRYPDLTVHRNLTKVQEGVKMDEEELADLEEKIVRQAQSSSTSERTAEEIEREVDKLKKAEFMKDRVGNTYTGTISGVTGFGLFVELPNTVEGLIRMVDLNDDFYNYDEETHRLIGENHGRIYELGQEIDVEVSCVDVPTKRIDFTPVYPRNNQL